MSVQCTEAEWKIMEVLWENHPRTMAEITKALAPVTGWTRHTVITLLKRMLEKGSISVDESGPVKAYSPLITREEALNQQTKKLVTHAFQGKAALLVQNLAEHGDITRKEMEEILSLLK